MKIDDKYNNSFKNLKSIIRTRTKEEKFPALGYTSNLDILCDFKIETFNDLLEHHMKDVELNEIESKQKVTTLKEFLSAVIFFCQKGIGGEVDIEDLSILDSLFDTKLGMGGTGVQAALALSSIGCSSIVHLTDDSREVCEILESEYIYTVDQNEKMVHTDKIEQRNEQQVHYIIQYKKGDIIRLGEEEIVIPNSNRIIFTKVTVNAIMPLNEAYFSFIEQNALNITSNVLSSFNCIVDKKILENRLSDIAMHVKIYKEQNDNGIVFFEDAHYHDAEIHKMGLETIYPMVDIVSLNEEELKYTLELLEKDIDINDILSCVDGAQYIIAKYNIKKGIIVHTKDYSIYVGKKLNVDIESGLIHGNLIATSKAMNGSYGTMEQIYEVLKLPYSKKGILNYEIVNKQSFSNEVIIVPSKYIDKPKYTIGLGDSLLQEYKFASYKLLR